MADEETQEEVLSVQEQIDSLDATVTALIDILIEKKLFTQEEFDKKWESMFEDEE